MKSSFLVSLLLALGAALAFPANHAHGDEVYPVPVPLRFIGHHQGNTGSCMAEATVGAIEHAFASRGRSVRLSTYYTHAYNWLDLPASADTQQEYAAPDRGLFSSFGHLLPAYMLPEDGRGFNAHGTGVRPSVSRVIAATSGFPAGSAYGYSSAYKSFQPGWANSMRDLNTIKAWLRERRPVTLALHGDMFSLLNDRSGLLIAPYSFGSMVSYLNSRHSSEDRKKPRHAVAIVGFDDSLYAGHNYPVGPGAFIVRNSWIENSDLQGVIQRIADGDKSLEMKRKLSPVMNEPGYYAIPYQYVHDLMMQTWPGGHDRAGTGGVTVYDINYDAFLSHYLHHEPNYEVIRAPFSCQWQKVLLHLQSYKRHRDAIALGQEPRATHSRNALSLLFRHQRFSPTAATFQLATLSRAKNGSVDRVVEFYAGAFNGYYCASGGEVSMPQELLQHPEFHRRLHEISLDPYGLSGWIRFFNFMVDELKI